MTNITFQNENIMFVDGSYMKLGRNYASMTSYGSLIRIAKPLIVAQIEELYCTAKLKNPNSEVRIGSIWLGRFAIQNIDAHLTEVGLYRRYKAQDNRGVFYDTADFKGNSLIHSYWKAVSQNGLQPEARQGGGRGIKNGLHLMATISQNPNSN
jgi:hypothetical protein